MHQVTLCFLVKPQEICIAMKKRGFGAGKWNGFGGKVGEGETITQAALRELKEEAGVVAKDEDLIEIGNINFYFDIKSEFNQQMYIFFINNWLGEPRESEEMKPRWFNKSGLPYNKMWVDDIYWLPQALAGKKIQGDFYFSNDGETIERFNIKTD